MKKILKFFFIFTLFFILDIQYAFAQGIIRGKVVDADGNEPLIGASVIVEGTTNGTVTDIDGNFSLDVKKSNPVLLIKYLGYKDKNINITRKGNVDIGTILMELDSKTLGDVVVTSSVAVARKTPVAASNVMMDYIEEKLGTQEFPEILKTTPGVHAQKDGGGFGDSEIYMRGFDNTNVATMINGVPMNDMENGNVYWSNWAGLTDVTRTMQTQRGLGASKVSVPSVGGTINIITKGLDSKKGGSIYYGMGNDNMNKILFTVSTGVMKNGFAVTLLGSKTWGDGYVQGTSFEGYNYFINVSKRINDSHHLSFTAFGAPQNHYQRNGALTKATWDMTKSVWGVQDYKYNSTFGYDNNGQMRNSQYNVYHKPQISLNHQWEINPKSALSTAVYVSIGRGYGFSGQGNETYGYSYRDWYGANYGVLQTKYRKADGTFDYGAIQDLNQSSQNGSMLVMTKSKNNHNWYGLISTYTTKLTDDVDFYGGVDFRYYNGIHTNDIQDLYNGDYYIDSNRNNVSVENNSNAANTDWKNQKLGAGDVVYRDYDSYVLQEGAFFQAEYNKDKIAAFIAGSLSNTSYWRYDRFYYDKQHARSKTVSFIGYTIKAGVNYNLTGNHNVFANIGYISRAPKFSYGAFMASTVSNTINKNAKNEKILSFELGYGYNSSWIRANLNAYYTKWIDKTMIKSGVLDNQEDYFMNMTGVHALHKGVELDFKAEPLKWLELSGMLSIGDWKWNSNAIGYAFDEQGNPLSASGEIVDAGSPEQAWAKINLKGVRIGGSAQTTASLGFNVNIDGGIRLGADWTLYARNYAYYSLSGSNLSLGKERSILPPWKIPAASQFDLNASYRFNIAGLNATLSGNINNLLDYFYISKAYNPRSGDATSETIYSYYAFGRTASVKLKVSF